MADVAIVNSKITTLNVDQELTLTAADEDTINTAQKFVYTPTGKDGRVVLGIQVGPTNGTVAYSIAGGAGVFGAAAKTGTTAQSTTDIVQIETGKYVKAGGTIEITFTPATGKKLKTDHALKVFAIELQ